MKKVAKLLFIFLLGFMIFPMVNAEELPTEGVMYFMDYPNGEERVVADYNEAKNPTETLIFSGVTDSNGKLNLCDWESEGQLRIVEHVPNGYTTSTKEVRVDLARDNGASFVNYRGLDNPKTGRSILVFLGIVSVITITILVSRKNKKSLLVIPVIIAALAVTYVKAEDTCFCIQVKDGSGKALSGVQIDIYAKPIDVSAAPAAKFDANGGTFFDGLDYFWIDIPKTPCTITELYEYLEEDGRLEDFLMDLQLAYREGYKVDKLYREGHETESEFDIENGSVIKISWQENANFKLIELDGNGGTFEFFGETNPSTYIYDSSDEVSFQTRLITATGFLKNGSKEFVGYDKTPACTRYNENGLLNGNVEAIPSRAGGVLYACWNNKPDGIYVNGELFGGTVDTCYKESHLTPLDNEFRLVSQHGATITIGDITTDDVYIKELLHPRVTNLVETEGEGHTEGTSFEGIQGVAAHPALGYTPRKEAITEVEVVKGGRTIVSFDEEDFEAEDGNYYILDDDNRPIFLEYIQQLIDNECLGE